MTDVSGEQGPEYIKPSQVAKITGLSTKHWQERANNGEIPSARKYGNNILFIASEFWEWWEDQLKEIKPWQKTSSSRKAPGGRTKQKTARRKKRSSTQQTKALPKKEETNGLKNSKPRSGVSNRYQPSEKLRGFL